ncbi:hypothetical protein GMB86_07215 [Terrilactibacillus sp. BCM23-1]|uniref:Purine catabolism PurC-like domain-containing protein n=1 Tax=Terrilactibacillus tamarindi TaxID=2599694 RepID=A0A6N8CQ55_9BACI|nr:PucR family transcriptional regulator ligand-binding domain-containing protein [Terrilactibacillus tamarindi]MTT31798.1 hypothetical protein [Terrilactibacillus tamarindi]
MANSVRQLYMKVKNSHELTLLAGEQGLDNLVRWIHTVESLDMSDFLHGNEMTFTTGVGLKEEEDLFNLIKQNVKNSASGMIVNIGPFIKNVTPEMIAYCNEHDFPLFSVPWHIYLADVIRIFTYELLQSEKKETELTKAIKGTIFDQNNIDEYLTILDKYGYEENDQYCIAAIQMLDSDENTLLNIKKEWTTVF